MGHNKVKISPSLLSANMARFSEAMQMIKDVADYIHCDVMDGHFVPNLTFGAPVVKSLKRESPLPLDVHLMIDSPGRWVGDYIRAGLDADDYLTFHVEAESNPLKILKEIRSSGVRAGIAIKPGTSLETITSLIEYADMILVMTVEPGFGGQKFISEMLPRLEQVSERLGEGQILAVDGGINAETARQAVNAGAQLLVAGGSVYGSSDPAEAIRVLRNAVSDIRGKDKEPYQLKR